MTMMGGVNALRQAAIGEKSPGNQAGAPDAANGDDECRRSAITE
jgi:hypothetical protein